MYKIAFVVPFFVRGGQLPNYFSLWLKTCGYNTDVNFLVFTDADMSDYNVPSNVTIKMQTWEQMQSQVQNTFNFPIVLDTPYKLCDYRCAYGEIFEDYLKDYDFWGHCDCDLFWGDIRKFITDEVLSKYDKIYSHGHCSLYRNVENVARWYRTLPSRGCQEWQNVFQTNQSRCFDEWAGHCGGGMSSIIKKNGIEIYDQVDFADLAVSKGYFVSGQKSYKEKARTVF